MTKWKSILSVLKDAEITLKVLRNSSKIAPETWISRMSVRSQWCLIQNCDCPSRGRCPSRRRLPQKCSRTSTVLPRTKPSSRRCGMPRCRASTWAGSPSTRAAAAAPSWGTASGKESRFRVQPSLLPFQQVIMTSSVGSKYGYTGIVQ